MLKIGVIGCGTMADFHFLQIENHPNAKLVAVCDSEILMAYQAKIRYNVEFYFDNIDQMINIAKPDIIHIVTPPESHYTLAKKCLEMGIHVYIEKPFTVYHYQAVEIINLAKQNGLKLTVGHNAQFSPSAIILRKKIEDGELGGKPIHMDSMYCYKWDNVQYAKAIIDDMNHWVNKLPGGLYHNIISHGISRLAEYLDDNLEIQVISFKSNFLGNFIDTPIQDELRVVIKSNNTTAYFTFSASIKPTSFTFKVYGQNGIFELDHNRQIVINYAGKEYRSYLKYVLEPWNLGRQIKKIAKGNVSRILKNKLRVDSGIQYLISSFYDAILNDKDLPIKYGEILRTSHIMEEIFKKIYPHNYIKIKKIESDVQSFNAK